MTERSIRIRIDDDGYRAVVRQFFLQSGTFGIYQLSEAAANDPSGRRMIQYNVVDELRIAAIPAAVDSSRCDAR